MKNSNFREFALAYIECALWSSTASGAPDVEENDDTSMDAYGYGIDDVEPKERLKAFNDCRHFFRSMHDLLQEIVQETDATFTRHGHDFWLTRNRHGSGFWDQGYQIDGEDLGDWLTRFSHEFGERSLYVGNDGKIYGF